VAHEEGFCGSVDELWSEVGGPQHALTSTYVDIDMSDVRKDLDQARSVIQ
jgi:hypothetical protein